MALSSLSTASLVFQIIILLVLGFGAYLMKFKRDLRLHTYVMLLAVILNIVSVVVFMLPTFGRIGLASESSDWMSGLVTAHHFIGLVAMALSIVLVGGWLISGRKPTGCPGSPRNKRAIMRAAYGSWVISIILGIVVYVIYL